MTYRFQKFFSITLVIAGVLQSPVYAQISEEMYKEAASASLRHSSEFKNSAQDFSMQVPTNWELQEVAYPTLYKGRILNGAANVSIITEAVSSSMTLAQYGQAVIDAIRRQNQIQILYYDDDEITVNGVPALRRKQFGKSGEVSFFQLVVFFVVKGKAYTFTSTTSTPEKDFFLPVFEKMYLSIWLKGISNNVASNKPAPVVDNKPSPQNTAQSEPVTTATTVSVAAPIRDKWALVVGISEFQDKRIPTLKYAAKDARDFRDFLVKEANFAPDHVRLLLNEKATERQVSTELGNKFLARVAKEGDLIVLYFSTHGSASKQDLKGKNYLVAYDSDRDDLYTTGIEMQKIVDTLNDRVESTRTLLVLDACHSGATTTGEKAMEDPSNFDAQELAQGSGKLVICSSSPDQKSWESARYQNGIFTRKLIEGLRMNGRKTKLGEAFTFVHKSVRSEVQEDQAVKQEPVLRSKWDGNDLTLAIPAAEPQALPESVKKLLGADSTLMAPHTSGPRKGK